MNLVRFVICLLGLVGVFFAGCNFTNTGNILHVFLAVGCAVAPVNTLVGACFKGGK